ncbi:uncharacterized protein LOC114254184 [Monomorium pharaonis]|uniref:uncharacterized protein LOC114254184 n=1 Tax=Monomorium pharaonis TaxID=307658 RepID=UPI00174602BF|nr:uncharacterized protein LOC114254184 [Monomorium pharaonis]XP_036141273.1 uncharacterized protein LOC114254184 [Monomorium pharaonis]
MRSIFVYYSVLYVYFVALPYFTTYIGYDTFKLFLEASREYFQKRIIDIDLNCTHLIDSFNDKYSQILNSKKKENMYCVVEFDQVAEGGLAIVHANWLTLQKKEVFWPPYKDHGRFKRALKKEEEINTNTWDIYGIVRSFYETDDLDKARQKLSVAEVTSDLNTEPEENLQSRKRFRTLPIRLQESSDDENKESDNECRFQQPPKIIKRTDNETLRTTLRNIDLNTTSQTSNLFGIIFKIF